VRFTGRCNDTPVITRRRGIGGVSTPRVVAWGYARASTPAWRKARNAVGVGLLCRVIMCKSREGRVG
jgi:hypothetical protein